MPIPDFDHNLVLPPHLGNPAIIQDISPYPCTSIELCHKFATSPERIVILKGFLSFRDVLNKQGLTNGFQWLDGSFLEDIETREQRPPNDLDLVTVFWNHDIVFQQQLIQNFPDFSNSQLSKQNYLVDHYPFDAGYAPDFMVEYTRYWIQLFTHNRDSVCKGMLQIPLNRATDDMQTFNLFKHIIAMVSRSNREYITVQLLETQRMLSLAGAHPLMSDSLKQKERDLIEQLEKIPVDKKDTKVTLLFNGSPVRGSWGIDAAFIGKITVPFQQMVTADFAHSINGKVGTRGQLKNESQSKLFLTALPRGSFGIELSKQDSDSIIENDQLSDSLSHITRLVDATAKSDEDFAAELDGTSPRTIQNLKDFLKIISDEQAGVTIESGGIRCDLTPALVKRAAERAGSTITTETIKTIKGTFRGILLESWRFDFRESNGNTISGDVGGHVSEREANDYMSQYFNRECSAVLKEGKVLFKNGRERTTYTLQSLEP